MTNEMNQKYHTLVDTLEGKKRFGCLPGIELSRRLLAAVGNPQNDLQFIHIAGTNGKGSTAAFLRQIFKEAGIRAGMFTSPHLSDYRERIQVDNAMIPREDVMRLGQMLLNITPDSLHRETDLEKSEPTMFDLSLAMALLYFREQNCDIVILETGLGGRLDSTNVIPAPLVGMITSIGYDHMEVLGSTLEEIAAEKAGIVKSGMQVISHPQDEEAEAVIRKMAQVQKAELRMVRDADVEEIRTFGVLRMKGAYQLKNAAAAMLAARALKQIGYPLTEDAIKKGIQEAVWPGRMEVLSEQPFFLADGAHNPQGVEALAKSLRELWPDEKFLFFMGVLADKDYTSMVEWILPIAKEVITVTVDNGRALQGEVLSRYILSRGVSSRTMPLSEGLVYLMRNANDHGRMVAFGSLYFIADVRKYFYIKY